MSLTYSSPETAAAAVSLRFICFILSEKPFDIFPFCSRYHLFLPSRLKYEFGLHQYKPIVIFHLIPFWLRAALYAEINSVFDSSFGLSANAMASAKSRQRFSISPTARSQNGKKLSFCYLIPVFRQSRSEGLRLSQRSLIFLYKLLCGYRLKFLC